MSLNVVPELNIDDIEDWVPAGVSLIKRRFFKLQKVRKELIKIYNEEFLKILIHQATDKTDRYKPTLHHSVNPGDIVLLKEQYNKPIDYPMARIQETIKNDIGEVTGVIVKKYRGNFEATFYYNNPTACCEVI